MIYVCWIIQGSMACYSVYLFNLYIYIVTVFFYRIVIFWRKICSIKKETKTNDYLEMNFFEVFDMSLNQQIVCLWNCNLNLFSWCNIIPIERIQCKFFCFNLPIAKRVFFIDFSFKKTFRTNNNNLYYYY